MKYFRVRTGHRPEEFISIGEDELERAIKAQSSGRVGVFREGSVSGNSIISITPDYNREFGWHPSYQPSGGDFEQIGRKLMDEYRDILLKASSQVSGLPEVTKVHSIKYPEESKKLADKFRVNP